MTSGRAGGLRNTCSKLRRMMTRYRVLDSPRSKELMRNRKKVSILMT